MHCAGCMGKVERGLTALAVESARVNLSARQVSVRHEEAVHVPDLVAALERIGLPASRAGRSGAPGQRGEASAGAFGGGGFCLHECHAAVGRVVGAGGATRDLFHWLSAGIGIPAILYAGRVFFASAWGALKHGAPIWMCRSPSACCWPPASASTKR
jgi:Cu2+-exporting ATPase